MDKGYFTSEHSPVDPITQREYHEGLLSNVRASMAEPNVIYEARATSRALENEGYAVSFAVQLDRTYLVGEPRRNAVIAFNLLLLNDDYQRIGKPYPAEMYKDEWHITDNRSIPLYRDRLLTYRLGSVRRGYLSFMGDDLRHSPHSFNNTIAQFTEIAPGKVTRTTNPADIPPTNDTK